MQDLNIPTDGFDLSTALRSKEVFNSTSGPRTSVLTELFQRGDCMMGPHVHGVAYRRGDFKYMEGIFQDLNYYYESYDGYLNTSDTSSMYAKVTEFLITHTEWIFGKGPFDTIRGVISIAFLQGHYIQEQGQGDTYLFNLREDPTESHNLASVLPSVVDECRKEVEVIKSQLPPQQPYWLVISEQDYLDSRVEGDCSMNPEIAPGDCLFHHPYIADDVRDSELTLIDDTIPLVERIALELVLIPLAKIAVPLVAMVYFSRRILL